MQTSAIEELNNFNFIAFGLKENYNALDKELQSEFISIEKAIKKIFESKKKIEPEVEILIPRIFSIRVKAISWLTTNNIKLNIILNEVLPDLEKISSNTRYRKLGIYISNALAHNRKFIEQLSSSNKLTGDSIEALKKISDFDYTTFIVALELIPSKLRALLKKLTHNSLLTEFISIVIIMLNEEKLTINDFKLKELLEFSNKVTMDYTLYMESMMRIIESENFYEESAEWQNMSLTSLSRLYDDEPDISYMQVKEPNPKFNLND